MRRHRIANRRVHGMRPRISARRWGHLADANASWLGKGIGMVGRSSFSRRCFAVEPQNRRTLGRCVSGLQRPSGFARRATSCGGKRGFEWPGDLEHHARGTDGDLGPDFGILGRRCIREFFAQRNRFGTAGSGRGNGLFWSAGVGQREASGREPGCANHLSIW